MERDNIIKALECCKTPLASDCENCSYTGKRLEDGVYEGCVNCLVGDALALINSQEQRIKELTEESKKWEQAYDCMHSACRELSSKCDRLTEENERLRAELAKRPPRLIITKLQEGNNGI